jgi:hypothetical protein
MKVARRVKTNMEEYDVIQCVDRGLDQGGSQLKQGLYWKIAAFHSSLRACILENPESFVQIVREQFGERSRAIEEAILSELRSVFDLGKVRDIVAALRYVRDQVISVSPA